MMLRVRAALSAAVLLAAGSAQAGELPAIKATGANAVPACVTPGRLAAFVEARNSKLDPRFGKIAVEYMRHGEDLGLRWDYAFFQMLVETGNLGFQRDVKPKQNNFAGLGATGNGEPGESFPDVSTGVRAHLQHVMLYAGLTVENPVAERTRKVQEWGILKPGQKGLTRPVTFQDLTIRWSPGDRNYARTIDGVAQKFFADVCPQADPKPEQVAEARKGRTGEVASAKSVAPPPMADAAKVASVDTAKPALERAKTDATRSSLGAKSLAPAAEAARPASEPTVMASAAAAPSFKVLNPQKPEEPAPAATPSTAASAAATAPPAKVEQTAAAAGAAKATTAPLKPSEAGKCRVWTASYGGQKAIIIKAPAGPLTHYTVLEVNAGTEKREADAYIAVYARGGQAIAEFASQEQALDKAFDLCPEG